MTVDAVDVSAVGAGSGAPCLEAAGIASKAVGITVDRRLRTNPTTEAAGRDGVGPALVSTMTRRPDGALGRLSR